MNFILDRKFCNVYNNGVINNTVIFARFCMALKDHSIDNRIIAAARKEFYEYGFTQASLRKIASRAEVTTGALYTRYKNKDELFEYLVSEVLIVMGTYGKEAMEHYYKAQETKNISDFLEAVSFESEMYLNILFDYYEQSVLLFCRSDGSLVGKKLNQIIEDKVESTVIYVADYLTNEVDPNAVRLLMNAGFSTYRSLLETVKVKKEAKKAMKEVGDFFNAGWKALFEKYM